MSAYLRTQARLHAGGVLAWTRVWSGGGGVLALTTRPPATSVTLLMAPLVEPGQAAQEQRDAGERGRGRGRRSSSSSRSRSSRSSSRSSSWSRSRSRSRSRSSRAAAGAGITITHEGDCGGRRQGSTGRRGADNGGGPVHAAANGVRLPLRSVNRHASGPSRLPMQRGETESLSRM